MESSKGIQSQNPSLTKGGGKVARPKSKGHYLLSKQLNWYIWYCF